MQVESSVKIVLGQKIVYKGDMANSPGEGAVVAVVAKQACPSGLVGKMYSMDFGAGKLVPVDDSFSFDVALEDGRMMRGLFESCIGGEFSNKTKRFMLAEGVASAEEIAGLLAGVALKKAADEAAAKAKSEAFAAAKAEALAAGLKLGLIPEAEFNKSGKRGSAAAYNLRAELKAAGIKASVKQDGYSALRVKVESNDSKEAVKLIMGKYKAGNFDGMSDCYEYSPCAWGAVFGDVQYVFGSSVEGYLF